jgi:predicted DNA-binding protein YlxM (UPF0122 family)
MELTKELLTEYVNKHYSQQRIADDLGISKGRVSATLRKYSLRTSRYKSKCRYCDTVLKGRAKIYCGNDCQNAYESNAYITRWLAGEEKGWSGLTKCLSAYIRKYLKSTRGGACEECGWDGKHPVDKASLTEIDHIDGDAENCRPENLKILCPNCHSMTPTFRARNKNSKRER